MTMDDYMNKHVKFHCTIIKSGLKDYFKYLEKNRKLINIVVNSNNGKLKCDGSSGL